MFIPSGENTPRAPPPGVEIGFADGARPPSADDDRYGRRRGIREDSSGRKVFRPRKGNGVIGMIDSLLIIP